MVGLHASAREQAAPRADFSRQAVSKAVLKQTLQKPYVLYPAAIGLLGAAAALLLGPSALFVVPAVAGAALGAGSWAVDYGLRRERHAGEYLRELHEALAGRRAAAVERLGRELSQADAKEAASQLQRLQQKYRAFEEMLSKKLNPAELTYARYLGMAEQVFLSGLDNLGRIVDTLKGTATIDEAYVHERIAALDAVAAPTAAQAEERQALAARLDLKAAQQARIEQWLAQNERAMTHMDHTMAAIAAMETVAGHASTDMETAMKELQALAERAGQYSTQV